MRAAVTVMGEDGYEGASMRDIAARAGVSVAALYYHFPSKQDLLREFLDEAYDVMLARLDRRLAAAPPTPEARLDEVVGTLIASRLHDGFARRAANVAFREYTRLNSPERASIDAKRRRLLEVVEGVVDEGVAHRGVHRGHAARGGPRHRHAVHVAVRLVRRYQPADGRADHDLPGVRAGHRRRTVAAGRGARSRPRPA